MTREQAVHWLTNGRPKEGAIAIGAFALGLCLAGAFAHWPGSPSDWAGWVQALGSIGAIIGAFAVASIQADSARKQMLEAAERDQQRKRDAIAALIVNARLQARSAESFFRGVPVQVIAMASGIAVHAIPEAVIALNAIPLHDLGSYDGVVGITSMISTLKVIEQNVTSLKMIASQGETPAYRQSVNNIQAHAALTAWHANKALAALNMHQLVEPIEHTETKASS